MMPQTPVSPVVQQHRQKIEPPVLKRLAVWCGIATAWVAIITALAHATAAGRGSQYVGLVLTIVVIAPPMPLFIRSGWRCARPIVTATLLTMVGATTVVTMVSMPSTGVPMMHRVAEIAFGSAIIVACAIFALGALHRLGEQARGAWRFLIVETMAIALVVWTENIAPALLAGVVYWILWKTTPTPPRTFTVYRGGTAK